MFGRLRRRRPEVATDTDAGATAFEDVPTRPAGYAQTASKMHAFNRYEIKYLVDELRVPELRAELARHMDTESVLAARRLPGHLGLLRHRRPAVLLGED